MVLTKEPHGEVQSLTIVAGRKAPPRLVILRERIMGFSTIATVVGYGGDSQNKHATTYFRTAFNVEDVSKISNSGLITAGIDDSAIIYLNGEEIGRVNLPKGQEVHTVPMYKILA